jgi:hypothetical protein
MQDATKRLVVHKSKKRLFLMVALVGILLYNEARYMHRLLNFAKSMEYITKLTQFWFYNYKITMVLGFRTSCKIGSTNTLKMYEITIELKFKSNSRLKTRCMACFFPFYAMFQ